MKIVSVVGARPQFIKAGDALARPPRRATRRSSSTPASTTTRSCPTSSSPSSTCPTPDYHLGVGSDISCPADGANAGGRRRRSCSRSSRTACSSTATRTRRLPAPSPRPSCGLPLGARRGGPAQLRPHDAGGDEPRPHRPLRRPPLLSQRSRRRVTWRARGSRDGVHLVGDVMYDSLLRQTPEDRSTQRASLAVGPALGGYFLATVHRAANTDDAARLGVDTAGTGHAAGDRSSSPFTRARARR